VDTCKNILLSREILLSRFIKNSLSPFYLFTNPTELIFICGSKYFIFAANNLSQLNFIKGKN